VSWRRGFIVSLFLILFFCLFPSLDIQNAGCESEPWLTGWTYRKGHIIGNSTGAGSGYPIRIIVHYGEGADSGDDVYLLGYGKPDFSDLRITDDDKTTVLGYFIQYKVDGDYAVVWFNVTDDLSVNDAYVYVYFGNSGAEYVGSWDQVFPFYDDFKNQTVSDAIWTYEREYSGTQDPFGHNYSSAIYHYEQYSKLLYVEGLKDAWPGDYCQIRNATNFRAGTYIVDFYQYDNKESGQTGYIYKRVLLGGEVVYSADVTDAQPEEITHTFSASKELSAGSHNITLQVWVSSGITNYPVNVFFEEIIVRKRVDPEPAHDVWGPLEGGQVGGGWLNGWTYRKEINITGVSGAGQNYPVHVTLMYGDGVSNSTHIFLHNHAQMDFDDVRFTDDDRTSLIPYFIIEKTDGESASVWFAPQDSLDSDLTVYLYYGNPEAASISDWENVFELYDKFDSFDTSLWTYSETRAGFNHDQYGSTYYSPDYCHRLYLPSSTSTFAGDFCRIYYTHTFEAGQYLLSLYVSDSYGGGTSSYHQKRVYFGGTLIYSDDVAGAEGWVNVEGTKTFSSQGTQTVELRLHENKGVTNFPVNVYWDDVLVRKYVGEPEPSISSISGEEVGTMAPQLGEWEAPSQVFADQYFFLNVTVKDVEGRGDIDYVSIHMDVDNVILKANQVGGGWTFTEYQDPHNLVILDSSGSYAEAVNSTAYRLHFKLKFHYAALEGNVSVLIPFTKAYDFNGMYSSGSWSNFTVLKYIEPWDVEVTNLDSSGYVFADTETYYLRVKVRSMALEVIHVGFSDGVHSINWTYDGSSFDMISGEDCVRIDESLINYSVENASGDLSGSVKVYTFPIWFYDVILDHLGVDVWVWANDTYGNSEAVTFEDCFSIFNNGGGLEIEVFGDAGRTAGGGIFDLFAYNDSYVHVNQTWRKLQHMHFLVSINLEDVPDGDQYTWQLQYGIYYFHEDQWQIGWKVVIDQAAKDTYQDAWVKLRIRWYKKGTYLIKTDYIMSLWKGGDVASQTGDLKVTSIWVDLWFNKANNSGIVGGRVNAEYFGLTQNSWWVFKLGTWSSITTNVTQSMFFEPLEDSLGQQFSAQELELMKFFCRLSRSGTGTYKVSLQDYDLEEPKLAHGRMEGVNEHITRHNELA